MDRLIRDQEVGGSNPLAPTIFSITYTHLPSTKLEAVDNFVDSRSIAVLQMDLKQGTPLFRTRHETSWSARRCLASPRIEFPGQYCQDLGGLHRVEIIREVQLLDDIHEAAQCPRFSLG